jgi:hypothetical protein
MYSRYSRNHPRKATNWHKNPLFVPRRVNKADILFIGLKNPKILHTFRLNNDYWAEEVVQQKINDEIANGIKNMRGIQVSKIQIIGT